MNFSCAVGKAIYELMGKIKNKHKPLVIKKKVDPKWWLTYKSLALLQNCAQICSRADRQVLLMHTHTHTHLNICAYKENTALRRLHKPFWVSQTYLLQRVVSWCSVLFKCHVLSVASFFMSFPRIMQTNGRTHLVIVFKAYKHIHKCT